MEGAAGRPRITTRTPRSFEDGRGATVLLAENEHIDFVEYLEFNAVGDVRGGHYHREYEEQFHVISGELHAEFLDMSSGRPVGPVVSLELTTGTTVTIPPELAHRFTARATARVVAFGRGPSPLTDRTDVDIDMWRNR